MKKIVALLAALTLMFACGCSKTETDQGKNNPNEGVTNNQQHSNNTTGSGIREDADRLGDDVKNGLENTGDAIKDGVKDTGEAIKDGVQDVGDAMTGDKNNTNNAEKAAPQTTTDNGTGVTTSPNP